MTEDRIMELIGRLYVTTTMRDTEIKRLQTQVAELEKMLADLNNENQRLVEEIDGSAEGAADGN